MSKSNSFHLRYDLDWALFDHEHNEGVVVYTFQIDASCLGYALFVLQQRPLRFQLGELIFYRKPLRRYELWAQPLIVAASMKKEQWKSIALKLLKEIRASMAVDEVISIEGLPTNSYFSDLLFKDAQVHKIFLVVRLGKPFEHQFVQMPRSYDEYLQQLSKGSRKSLTYKRRKLYKNCSGDVVLQRSDSDDQVEKFLKDAIHISKMTYQWHLLGLGLRDRNGLARRLYFAARRGWLRSYILYCRGEPVAFLLGYQYRGRYYYMDVGYDPAWSQWSVGSVLQLEVMKDLYTHDGRPEIFDFSTGYGQHKARFANFAQEEVNLLLLPKTFRNKLLVSAYHATECVSEFVSQCSDRLGFKRRIKKMIRRLAIARS